IVARRQISGLNCRHIYNPATDTWDQSSPGTNLIHDSQDLATAIQTVGGPLYSPLINQVDVIAERIRDKEKDVFYCDESAIDYYTNSAPAGADIKVAFTPGSNSRWWRSNVPLSTDNPVSAAIAYLTGDDDTVSNYIMLAPYNEATKWNLWDTGYDVGRTLLHEFGHAFAKLPDFYISDSDKCPEYRGMMCAHLAYNFASPVPANWYHDGTRRNLAYGKVKLVDKLNAAVGGITSISTGFTFPNPNYYPTNCTAKSFNVTYAYGAKQLSYITEKVYDISGKLVYQSASEKPVPNGSDTYYYGERAGVDTDWYPTIGFGWPGVDQAMNLVASGVYFVINQHGHIQSISGIGNKNTLFRKVTVPTAFDPNCSPVH
ncbi:MAG: hypothetical protein D6719_11900, partial [Candidatus Dadabacteria bacterium]